MDADSELAAPETLDPRDFCDDVIEFYFFPKFLNKSFRFNLGGYVFHQDLQLIMKEHDVIALESLVSP